mmetsp:Transcript_43398/g.122921  ORF Transcript_43398/g.122921 Transcript_43398/m.122921 type:complete len:191 (-) Transcript_43398:677-1249(-)
MAESPQRPSPPPLRRSPRHQHPPATHSGNLHYDEGRRGKVVCRIPPHKVIGRAPLPPVRAKKQQQGKNVVRGSEVGDSEGYVSAQGQPSKQTSFWEAESDEQDDDDEPQQQQRDEQQEQEGQDGGSGDGHRDAVGGLEVVPSGTVAALRHADALLDRLRARSSRSMPTDASPQAAAAAAAAAVSSFSSAA